MTSRFNLFILVATLNLLSGCTGISYIQNSSPQSIISNESNGFGRKVNYHLARAFYEAPPACVMVLPTQIKNVPGHVTRTIDDSVSRHLSTRIDKVIDTRRVTAKVRHNAYDPKSLADRQRMAQIFQCDSIIEINTTGIDSLYALVWTNISIEIEVTLRRTRDNKIIWRSRHRARRSDGGLPLSIMGAGGSLFAAGTLASDADTLPSMIDDTVRRIMASLPNIRKL